MQDQNPEIYYEDYLEKKNESPLTKEIKPNYLIWIFAIDVIVSLIIYYTIGGDKSVHFLGLGAANIIILWVLVRNTKKHIPRDIMEAMALGHKQMVEIIRNSDKIPVILRATGKPVLTGTATTFPKDVPQVWRLGYKIEDVNTKKGFYYLLEVGYWKDDVAIKTIQELMQPYNAEEPYVRTEYAPVEKIPSLERWERLNNPPP